MAVIVPTHLFNPASIKADPVENVITGGKSLSGETDVIATDGGGRWRVQYSGITLRTPEAQRRWDQWVSYLKGGAQAVLVPIVSLRTAPRPVAGGMPATPSAMHTNDPVFPTIVRFAAPYITAQTVDDAALRSTSIKILITKGARIQGGERFSIGERAYKVERVTARSGMQVTCTISPPLREAVNDGTEVNFEWPVVKCRAAVGQDLAPEMVHGRAQAVSIVFEEVA